MLDGDEVSGRCYRDPPPREGKYNHAAAFTKQRGDKGQQLPIVALVCNFHGGTGGPGYLEHSDEKTFLHEFQHLFHAIFGGTHHWLSMSGVSHEWNFVDTR